MTSRPVEMRVQDDFEGRHAGANRGVRLGRRTEDLPPSLREVVFEGSCGGVRDEHPIFRDVGSLGEDGQREGVIGTEEGQAVPALRSDVQVPIALWHQSHSSASTWWRRARR